MCRGWTDFLEALNAGLGIAGGTIAGQSPDALYRVADRAAFRLRLLRGAERSRIISDALLDPGQPHRPPAQALALARGYWPLVVSTNYDDVFLAARGVDRRERRVERARMQVVGRGPADCEAVVRSMDSIHPPILWCIQGFAGGPLKPPPPDRGPTGAVAAALLDQIVIGHQQYQLAANQSPAFRRAFAEVYRRRSLVFVGSGLAESYFVNLISEIVLNFGPSPQPHFALFSADEIEGARIDCTFLQTRLGITAVQYGHTHAELPEALAGLCEPWSEEHQGPAPEARVPRPLAMSFAAPRLSAGEGRAVEVSLRFARLAKPAPGECAVLSVGLQRNGDGLLTPLHGAMAKSFLREHYGFGHKAAAQPAHAAWVEVARRLYRLRVEGRDQPVFAAAARKPDEHNANRRDLHAITETTAEGLAWIEGLGEFRALRMGVLGAGDMKFANPIYCFIAQLSGVRRFFAKAPRSARTLQLIEIGILDPRITTPVIEGRMPARELLSSDLVRVFVRVADTAARWEGYTESVSANSTVRDVLLRYNVVVGEHEHERVRVAASPLPYPKYPDVLSAPVFPTMTIDVRPREAEVRGAPPEPRVARPERQLAADEGARGGPAPPGRHGEDRPEAAPPPEEDPSPSP